MEAPSFSELDAPEVSEEQLIQRKVSPEMMLGFFIHEYPDYVEEVPVLVYDSRRRKQMGVSYRWAERPATITMAVPDDVVKNMRGEEDQKDWYVMMRVSREGLELLKEAQSPIIKPPGLVKP